MVILYVMIVWDRTNKQKSTLNVDAYFKTDFAPIIQVDIFNSVYSFQPISQFLFCVEPDEHFTFISVCKCVIRNEFDRDIFKLIFGFLIKRAAFKWLSPLSGCVK